MKCFMNLCRDHANSLCIVPMLVYVLVKGAWKVPVNTAEHP